MDDNLGAMTFAQFAQAVRPSGAVNRYTIMGRDVHSWSVYMNGPLAERLPTQAREHEYKDVSIAALTEKLGLNADSFRDTLKVAEVVAVSAAYLAMMQGVIKEGGAQLPEAAMDDCLTLADRSNMLKHPWIARQIEAQKAVSKGLGAGLKAASAAVGRDVSDRAPREVGAGRIVAQTDDFTMQHTTDGEVVTHENRRLSVVPAMGDDVTVSYYRGHGQVVASLAKMKVSPPFIEPKSKDLAVLVLDGSGAEQVVLFNSMASFRDFAAVHGLDPKLVIEAMDVRAASPKPARVAPLRRVKGEPYIEQESGCIAMDFSEGGMEHAVLFQDVEAMRQRAGEYGITPAMVGAAMGLRPEWTEEALAASKQRLGEKLYQMGHRDGVVVAGSGWSQGAVEEFSGPIIAEDGAFVVQDTGRGKLVAHDLRTLDKVVREGESLTVKYNEGRGVVSDVERGGHNKGR